MLPMNGGALFPPCHYTYQQKDSSTNACFITHSHQTHVTNPGNTKRQGKQCQGPCVHLSWVCCTIGI